MMPALRPGSLGPGGNGAYQHIAAGRPVLTFRSGRLALAEALHRSGVASGDEVLLPAYHCQSIVDPIVAAGAKPVFYRLRPDLSTDFDDVRRKLARSCRSIIAVHFFGVLTDLISLRALCDEQGITLIEDCAHCFSYSREAPAYGRTGDYVITSVRKFIPVYDGGELYSPTLALDNGHRGSPDPRYQLKIAANILQRGWRRRRLDRDALPNGAAAAPLDRGINEQVAVGEGERNDRDYVDPRFDLSYVKRSTSLAARGLTRMVSLARVERARKSTYRKLMEANGSWRLAKLPFPALDRAAVPYVFPLELREDANRLHARLKQAGVPMWRWDDLCESDCSVSAGYRSSLIQLPCHQELTPEFVDRMICALEHVLG